MLALVSIYYFVHCPSASVPPSIDRLLFWLSTSDI